MRQYTRGDAIIFKATFTDSAGTLVDPSSTWGRVWDATSTVVNSFVSLAPESTGKFSATWQSSEGGEVGPVAFDAFGLMGALVFRRREKLVELV